MMNNLISNFNQILDFARQYNLDLGKKRAILREYLQSKILEFIYQQKISKNLFFVGGTSLRLLRNLDRFSEDLDFDIVGLDWEKIEGLMENLYRSLTNENFKIDFYRNKTEKRSYYEFRFKDLLQEINLSANKEEKLMIKFDFESYWKSHSREIILFDRYGFLVNVVSIPKNQILVEKLYAYLKRKETQPRDIYDIIWLISQMASLDFLFMKKNKVSKTIIDQALKKFEKEKKKLTTFKSKIKPFLINEYHINKLDFFPALMERLISKEK